MDKKTAAQKSGSQTRKHHSTIPSQRERILAVLQCDGARRHLRDTAIREDFDRMTATMTARAAMMELARGSGLTSRRVWDILKNRQGGNHARQQAGA